MAGGPRSATRPPGRAAGKAARAGRRGGGQPGRQAGRDNIEVVRRIFERWGAGDTGVEWAHADIDFCGPDLRAGQGVDHMVSLWGRWLESMDEFAVVPDRFLEAGADEVLVPARLICQAKSGGPPKVRTGVSLFKLRDGKVSRLSFFVDREPA